MDPTRIAVLGSTNGSDLPALVKSIEEGKLRGLAEIEVIISDNNGSGILKKARDYNIENYFIDPKDDSGRKLDVASYNDELDKRLDYHNVELIVNIGWMRMYSEGFVEKWWGKNMNIHPSLLPAFAGGMDLDVHAEVLKRGCRLTGPTLHFIDKGADTGPIIMQYTVPVERKDTADMVKAKVQAAEQMMIPYGVQLFAEGRLKLVQREVLITTRRTEEFRDIKYQEMAREMKENYFHLVKDTYGGMML